jgi:ABC-type Fe3+-hydroxamate transport system substrate-binding protein
VSDAGRADGGRADPGRADAGRADAARADAGRADDGGPRVVSLVPSVTESLLAWGVRPVAVTRFCEQPGFRTVGGTKDPDVAAIVELAPDLVVVNDEENRREDAEAIREAGLRVHVTHVESIADVDPTLDALAATVGAVRPRAEWALLRRIAGESTGEVAHRSGRRVFVPVWRRPWMTMNARTYGSSVLVHLGLVNVFADAEDRYPTVELDEVARRRPDVVLLPSEPYPFAARHVDQVAGLAADVRLVDGQDLFWWGVRTAAAIDRLRQAIGS